MVSLASTRQIPGVIAPGVGGGLKRKQIDESPKSEKITSAQTKRRRVTFDPDVDVHIVDPNGKSLELVGEEVRRALEKREGGDNTAYDQLRSLFTVKPTSSRAVLSGQLQKYLIALTNNVPLLDNKCKGLVHAIIDCHWATRNEQFVRTYRNFIRSLLSMQPGFASSFLAMLVEMFIEQPSPAMRQQDDPTIERVRIQSRIHDVIKAIVRQNPMSSTYLGSILSSNFPFPTDTAKAHVHYIRNILKVSEYCPELKGEILSLIMDKVVKIDVQIQADLEELDDDVEDRLIDDDIEEDEDESDNESISSEESLDTEEKHIKELKESVTKLDNIMDILFSHYDSVLASGNRFEIDDSFESLLSQFASIILPTYRSRHTQFLLFHYSQTSSDLIERFAGCCAHLAFDRGKPEIARISAAAYLASYTARGAHISKEVVRDVFDLLCHQLEDLRITQEPNCKGPDLRRYSSYYAIAQALLYAYCFRWRDLIVTPDDTLPTDEDIIYHEGDFEWHASIQSTLRRNIFSKLNPLKICSPAIVQQFASIAHHLRFLYVFPLMETNKRVRLSRAVGAYSDGIGVRDTALTMKKGEEGFLMDAYFPFDPYMLTRSKKWVQGDYNEWKAIPGMREDVDEGEGDEEADDGEDSADEESESQAYVDNDNNDEDEGIEDADASS
ncbi:RNA polymerase I-specific transcription initiation factor RRN3 [Byssothecium circinans]|uniref:RNA polymerase I-specific transcription initiation factor RRN3 n=1 Tax=Byssothecium circinans TaxID=147558 RepID=A0A6A5TCM4_9PLEO|nr:RNA polymerase I-specific transcription initiation factor RRN3 [Byssothecium circinans]